MPTTIVRSDVKIFSDSAMTTQVGNTITTNSDATAIIADYTSLGVNLAPGTNYWASARCTNSESYTSPWTSAFNFKTLILVQSVGQPSAGATVIGMDCRATYGSAVSPSELGYYISESANGANATRVVARDEQQWEQFDITGLTEHTLYYIIPFVVDNLNREYHPDWSAADDVMTSYSRATITFAGIQTTHNSISPTVSITSTTSITAGFVTIQAQGGTQYKLNLTNNTGSQTVTFTDGATDANGNTIAILPSTTYTVVASVTNSGGTNTANTTATTAATPTSEISISSITNITPTSATVNLSFS